MPLPVIIAAAMDIFTAARVAGTARTIAAGAEASGVRLSASAEKYAARNKRNTRGATPAQQAAKKLFTDTAKSAKEKAKSALSPKVSTVAPNTPSSVAKQLSTTAQQQASRITNPIEKADRVRDALSTKQSRRAARDEIAQTAKEALLEQFSISNIVGSAVDSISPALGSIVRQDLIKAGYGPQIKGTSSKMMKAVRDQKYNINSGRIYNGVKNLKVDDSTPFNYDELARRVSNGENMNTVARELLFDNTTMTFSNGTTARGQEARELAEQTTSFNRQVERMEKNGFKSNGREYDANDVKEAKKDGKLYKINAEKANGADSLDRISSANPKTVLGGRDNQTRVNLYKSMRSAGVPPKLRERFRDRVEMMGYTELRDRMKTSPSITTAAYSSSNMVYTANIAGILRAFDVDFSDKDGLGLVDKVRYRK